jgi:uncharacterized protein YwgA
MKKPTRPEFNLEIYKADLEDTFSNILLYIKSLEYYCEEIETLLYAYELEEESKGKMNQQRRRKEATNGKENKDITGS